MLCSLLSSFNLRFALHGFLLRPELPRVRLLGDWTQCPSHSLLNSHLVLTGSGSIFGKGAVGP